MYNSSHNPLCKLLAISMISSKGVSATKNEWMLQNYHVVSPKITI